MNLRKTTKHGLTECLSNDIKEQAQCDAKKDMGLFARADDQPCTWFKNFNGYWVCTLPPRKTEEK